MNKSLKYALYGAASAVIGLGLQNYNPFEPRACTHSCSIALGILIFFIAVIVIPFVESMEWIWKLFIKRYLNKPK